MQYTGPRSIVVAAALADFSDDDIDLLIEEHETISDEPLSVEELEEKIMEKVDDPTSIRYYQGTADLEFDLAGMNHKELASTGAGR